jgi:hypothetical protein
MSDSSNEGMCAVPVIDQLMCVQFTQINDVIRAVANYDIVTKHRRFVSAMLAAKPFYQFLSTSPGSAIANRLYDAPERPSYGQYAFPVDVLYPPSPTLLMVFTADIFKNFWTPLLKVTVSYYSCTDRCAYISTIDLNCIQYDTADGKPQAQLEGILIRYNDRRLEPLNGETPREILNAINRITETSPDVTEGFHIEPDFKSHILIDKDEISL